MQAVLDRRGSTGRPCIDFLRGLILQLSYRALILSISILGRWNLASFRKHLFMGSDIRETRASRISYLCAAGRKGFWAARLCGLELASNNLRDPLFGSLPGYQLGQNGADDVCTCTDSDALGRTAQRKVRADYLKCFWPALKDMIYHRLYCRLESPDSGSVIYFPNACGQALTQRD